MFEVTLVPVLFAGIASMLIAFVWYNPKVFGNAWAQMSGLPPGAQERGRQRMPFTVPGGLAANMLVAYIMTHFGIAWGVYDIIGAIELGFWCWAGFVAPILFGSVLWEERPFALYLINVGYWLVAFVAMALVLVFLG